MNYSSEVQKMCTVAKGPKHGPAPIPEEGRWVKAYDIKDISGLSHGIGWCAPQQGCCKLSLNVKNGIIEEALVETIGCSGMTHSAAMAAEILQGKTLLEALNTDLVCDAINVAMRETIPADRLRPQPDRFLRGRPACRAGLEDLGKGLRSQVGTMFAQSRKACVILHDRGLRAQLGLDENSEVIGYKFVSLGKMMEAIRRHRSQRRLREERRPLTAASANAVKYIDPREE
jgi:NifU-like protein involved in Fe-S cluster formation